MPRTTGKMTMAEIARLAGVSTPTVSYILNGRARERHLSEATTAKVRKIAETHGYIPNGLARNLRRQSTNSVGLLVSDLERGWANRLLKGMLKVLDDNGYFASLSVHYWDPRRERRELQSYLQEKKAAIITRPMPENLDVYRQILNSGTPLIFLDALSEFPECNHVLWDTRRAIEESIEYLTSKGCKRIAFYGVERGTEEERWRLDAFCEAMNKFNLPVEEEWIFRDQRYELKEGTGALKGRIPGYGDRLKAYFERGENLPDAILASSDALACTCITILRDDLGYRIPEDIAIMGMGDTGESWLIGLSTSKEPIEEIGEEAARTAIDLIKGDMKGPVHRQIVSCELMKRSTA